MRAQAAHDSLRPDEWAATRLDQRLRILEGVQLNMLTYATELAAADRQMRNGLVGEDAYSEGVSVYGTVGLIGGTIAATIDLYKSIAAGKMLTAKHVTDLGDGTYDLEVFPQTTKDRVTAGRQRGHLRVKGEPRQTNPFDKSAGVIAVLGAGNYSSSIETVNALFWENKAVIHKPHPLNQASDAVWQSVFSPLIEIGALAFCDPEQSVELTQLNGLTAIYFTGGANTAKAIMQATDTPLVSECGGNNPCIVVPGDRPWTEKELDHQAVQFVTLAKLNGGAVCGRAQTLVTSRSWPQREQFLNAVRKAYTEETPAISTYYPGSEQAKARFAQEYPDAEVLVSEGGKHASSDGLLISSAASGGFAAGTEAFCQVIAEIPIDANGADDFLSKATEYCNKTLLGSLTCMIIIDEDARKGHQDALDAALGELRYGGIAVNTIPPLIFANPYLSWGGNEEGEEELVSGRGNFGNLLGYENVEKAIMYDRFVSMTHFLYTKKKPFDELMASNARFMMRPTWPNLARMTVSAARANFARKDF